MAEEYFKRKQTVQYIYIYIVVSWTRGLRDIGRTINNVARKPKCAIGQSNSFVEKAYVTLTTNGCETRAWWG